MPQLIQPHSVSVISKEGEVTVHLTLDLNVNLNTGSVTGGVSARQEEEKVDWAIPDFKPSGTIKFGKTSL